MIDRTIEQTIVPLLHSHKAIIIMATRQVGKSTLLGKMLSGRNDVLWLNGYLEEENGQLQAFEFKWNERKADSRCPAAFATAYPDATFQVITPANVEEYLL